MEELLHALDQCLEEVDSDVVVMREVGVAFDGGKVISVREVSSRNKTYTSLFDLYLAANAAAVMTCAARSLPCNSISVGGY